MSFPADIVLPANAKYYSYVADDYLFNSNYEITWSFQYLLSNFTPQSQYGLSTFLTVSAGSYVSLPGQYLGGNDTLDTLSATSLLSEASVVLITESGETLIVNQGVVAGIIMHIAFDSTGLFAVSGTQRPGISPQNAKKNALVIRDYNSNVIVNEHLSAISSNFSLTSNEFTVLRFRYSNIGQKLFIDYRPVSVTDFTNLTSINLSYRIVGFQNTDGIYTGFSYCSPISTTAANLSASLLFRNYHVEGVNRPITTKTLSSTPLTQSFFNTYS